jgi:hypothetical protein
MILPTSDLYRKLYSVACLRARPYQPLAVEWERTGQRRRKEMVIDSFAFQGVVTSHWEIAGTVNFNGAGNADHQASRSHSRKG